MRKETIILEKNLLQQVHESNTDLALKVMERKNAATNEPPLKKLCEEILSLLWDTQKQYTTVEKVLSDLANIKLQQLEQKHNTTYETSVREELRSCIFNKLAYRYLGNQSADTYYEKMEVLNSFLDERISETYSWHAHTGACKKCKQFSDSVYEKKHLPQRPHPNCRCKIYPVSKLLLNHPGYLALPATGTENQLQIDWDGIHILLDIAGLFPGMGAIPDGLNAIIYLLKGDLYNGILSAMAMIPFSGYLATGKKLGARIGKLSANLAKVDDAPKLIHKIKSVSKSSSKEIFESTLRGKTYRIPEISMTKVNYHVREYQELFSMRIEFNNKKRKSFLQMLSNETEKLAKAGFTADDIARLEKGKVPYHWQVHHKMPLADSGTNEVNNLVLIQNEPYHKLITNYQKKVTQNFKKGQSYRISWPDISGDIFPPIH